MDIEATVYIYVYVYTVLYIYIGAQKNVSMYGYMDVEVFTHYTEYGSQGM